MWHINITCMLKLQPSLNDIQFHYPQLSIIILRHYSLRTDALLHLLYILHCHRSTESQQSTHQCTPPVDSCWTSWGSSDRVDTNLDTYARTVFLCYARTSLCTEWPYDSVSALSWSSVPPPLGDCFSEQLPIPTQYTHTYLKYLFWYHGLFTFGMISPIIFLPWPIFSVTFYVYFLSCTDAHVIS